MSEGYILGEHERRIAAMLQPGVIEEIDYKTALARVRVNNWVSAWLPWHSSAAGTVSIWNPPSVGEQCLILAVSGQPELGFILPGFYTKTHPIADSREKVTTISFPDGAKVSHDWENGELTVSGSKTINIESSGVVTIKAQSVKLEVSKLSVSGNIEASGDVKAGSISLKSHVHQAQGSNSPTSPPK